MTAAETRALEVRCPARGADRSRRCIHLSMSRPAPWLPDRDWLDAQRARELVRPHRQRVDRFRERVLHREEDHRGQPYRLTQAAKLRSGQVVLVGKLQVEDGLIVVPRTVRTVTTFKKGQVWVHFRGRIWPRWIVLSS